MAPGSEEPIIAGLARVEERVGALEKLVLDLREDGKDRRAETSRLLELLNAKIDGVSARVSKEEATSAEMGRDIKAAKDNITDIDKRLAEIMPHVEDFRSAKEQQKDRKGTLWRPMLVGIGASVALVLCEIVAHHFGWA